MGDESRAATLTFRNRFAERLASGAEEITDAWVEAAARRPDLSLETLRNEIPSFLRSVATAVREDATGDERTLQEDYLETHVRDRLEHGYSLRETLEEFDALPPVLYGILEDLIASSPDVPAGELHDVHRRVERAMHRVGRVAARFYREIDMEERRGLAEQLTSFGQALEHELRDPLHTSLVAIDRLEDQDVREDPDSYDRYLGVLRGKYEEMADLLTEVRRLSAVRHTLAEPERLPAREVIDGIFEELDAMADSHGVELRTGDIDERVHLEVPRLQLAIRNLAANAIKYSDPGEETPYVEVSLRAPDEGPYRLTVEDNGIGVPEDARERIFEPGERASPGRASGTGLGLAIVRQALEQRRGTVSLEPKENGSRFVLELSAPLAVRET